MDAFTKDVYDLIFKILALKHKLGIYFEVLTATWTSDRSDEYFQRPQVQVLKLLTVVEINVDQCIKYSLITYFILNSENTCSGNVQTWNFHKKKKDSFLPS